MADHPERSSHNTHSQRGSEQGKEPSTGTEKTVAGPKKNAGVQGNSDNVLRDADAMSDKPRLFLNE